MPREENNPNVHVPEEQEVNEWQALAENAAEWPAEHEGLQQLRENHIEPLLREKGIASTVTVTKDDKAGGRFLHRYGAIDKDELQHVIDYTRQSGEKVTDKAGDRIATYLRFMADTVNDGILTGNPQSVNRQISAHVIKAEEIPESYFETQQRIARERGHGDIQINQHTRKQLTDAIIADQKSSLNKWVEYLGGDDGSYPDWFKRYTWDSVIKLGAFDKERGKFMKRETTTVAPYPELNREALANVYDTVKKFHVLGETIDDADLKKIVTEGSFSRLYTHAMFISNPERKEMTHNIQGKWKKFSQTQDPRTARRLSGSLAGYGTGWCTAGESTAEEQLSEGDFYVYYSDDEDGTPSIPRIAIRMANDSVEEVRGILEGQELEPALLEKTMQKLKGLPGGSEYMQKAEDMKRLTDLDNSLKNDPQKQLSKEDLVFLYETEHIIEGFGYDRDPRIGDIIKSRDVIKDIADLTGLDLYNLESNEIIEKLLEEDCISAFYYLLKSRHFNDINSETLHYLHKIDLVDSKHIYYIAQLYGSEYSIYLDELEDYSGRDEFFFAVVLAENIESFSNIGLWAVDILKEKIDIKDNDSILDRIVVNFRNFDIEARLSIIEFLTYGNGYPQDSAKWRATELFKMLKDVDLAKLSDIALHYITTYLDEDHLIGPEVATKLGEDFVSNEDNRHLFNKSALQYFKDLLENETDINQLAYDLGYFDDDEDDRLDKR